MFLAIADHCEMSPSFSPGSHYAQKNINCTVPAFSLGWDAPPPSRFSIKWEIHTLSSSSFLDSDMFRTLQFSFLRWSMQNIAKAHKNILLRVCWFFPYMDYLTTTLIALVVVLSISNIVASIYYSVKLFVYDLLAVKIVKITCSNSALIKIHNTQC